MPRAATLSLVSAILALAVSASAGAAGTQDRYGPPHASDLGAATTASPPPTGFLTWAAKTPASPEPQPVEAAPRWTPSPAPAAFEPRPARSNPITSAAPPTSLYGAYPAARPSDAPAAPTRWSPPARATATAQASPSTPQRSSSNLRPHYYSVAREYGLKPDPIPLPRQFFAGGAPDLAAPPPPLPPHPVPGSQAATSPANTAANRAREVEIETADSAAN